MTLSTTGPGSTERRAAVPELFRRQPVLAALGLFYGLALVPALAAATIDPRLLDGAEVWTKPVKFLLSLMVYCLTLAWFFGYVEDGRRRGPAARLVVWTVVATSVPEMAYIALQAGLGERSHFNFTDTLHLMLFSLMGIGALLLIGMCLPLAYLIARRPAPGLPPYRDAVVLGLVLTALLGGGMGVIMASRLSHWVGPQPSAPGLPFFGWSTTGGDLRPAHFFGAHAAQALPVMALLGPGRGGLSRAAVWLLALGYAVFTVWVLLRALADLPFLAL